MENKFLTPQDISDADYFYPARVSHLMPRYEDIPEEFSMYDGTSIFCKLQNKWFFQGLEDSEIPPAKPGIDRNKALRHLAAIQKSFEPQHEHKSAAVAYLMSLWFEEPKEVKPITRKNLFKC